MKEGQKVKFTAKRLGLVINANTSRFEPETVGRGDEGTYLSPHPAPALQDEWHLIKVTVDGRELLAPVHVSMFEVAEADQAAQ